MTREQKEEVKRLREAGMSYQAVGERFGVSKQRIHQIVTRPSRRRKLPKTDGIKYPKIKQYLEENNVKVTDLATACGVTNATMWGNMRGCGMRKSTIDAILKVTGLTYEEAFSEEEDVE